MATSFVLVHGAFGGSYGFRGVRPLLWGAGHEVHTPSLTGIGDRAHHRTPEIDLDLHVRDLVATIEIEDLHDIVLLGFSYGGMVITGALDHIGERVSHLVYLDAFVPADGESAVGILGSAGEAMQAAATDGYVPPIGRDLGSEEANAWSDARRVGQPLKTLTSPVSLSKPLEEWPFTRTFIKATADEAESDTSPFWTAHHRAMASDAWEAHEIATNHMVPALAPEELANILLSFT